MRKTEREDVFLAVDNLNLRPWEPTACTVPHIWSHLGARETALCTPKSVGH